MSATQTLDREVAPTLPPAALTPKAAAAYLGRPGSEKTLANWRYDGRGPRVTYVLGMPAYRVEDLDEYLANGGDGVQSNRSRHSSKKEG